MQIGILEAGRVRDALQAAHGTYPAMFRRLLSAVEPSLGFRTYAVLEGELPACVRECDAWLVTGSRHTAFDRLPWMVRLEAFLASAMEERRPVVGICFGHQILAQALGGTVARSADGWGLGTHSYEILHTSPWMAGAPQSILLNAVHQDQVTTLPPEARVLAGSPFCPAAIVAYSDNALTIQAHPEFEPAYVGDLVSELERDGLPASAASEARERLEAMGNADSALVARWIVAFLTVAASARRRT